MAAVSGKDFCHHFKACDQTSRKYVPQSEEFVDVKTSLVAEAAAMLACRSSRVCPALWPHLPLPAGSMPQV
jgi:hypothetical protein